MSNRLYHDPRINIENVATDLEHTFLSQGYQVQHFGNSDHMTVQMRKGGDLATIIGMQTALTVTMQRSPRGILTMIGHQKWDALDMSIRKQNPEVQFGPIPPEMMPQYEQSGAPQTSSPPPWQRWTSWSWPGGTQKVICANCQTPNEVGDSYCMQCGHALTPPQPQKILCPNCGAETKASATFCTKCGTSLTQKEEPGQN